MTPAVLAHYVYTKRDRLKDKVCIQVLLPEHEEQQCSIHIPYIKVALAVSSSQKDRSKTEYSRQKIYQQHRLSTHLKKYYIPKLHQISF